MERYKEYVNILTEVCKEKFLQISNKKINNGFKFHYVTINGNREYEKTVAFSAGIHGNELAGPYAILKFLMDHKELDPSIRVVIFPCVNPYGFDNEQRGNAFKQDINRRFCDKLLAGEAKCVSAVLKKTKPDYFVSLHEWHGKDGFYMYASDSINKETIDEIPKIASKNDMKVFKGNKINGEKVINGVIWHPQEGYSDVDSRCTLENKMYNDGIHYICTETPGKAKLTTRVKVQVEIMHFIINKLIKE